MYERETLTLLQNSELFLSATQLRGASWYAVQHCLTLLDTAATGDLSSEIVKKILHDLMEILKTAHQQGALSPLALTGYLDRGISIAARLKLKAEFDSLKAFKAGFDQNKPAIPSPQGTLSQIEQEKLGEERLWLQLSMGLLTKSLENPTCKFEIREVSAVLKLTDSYLKNQRFRNTSLPNRILKIAQQYNILNLTPNCAAILGSTINGPENSTPQTRGRSSGVLLQRSALAATENFSEEKKIDTLLCFFEGSIWESEALSKLFYYILPIAKRVAKYDLNTVIYALDKGIMLAEQHNLPKLKFDLAFAEAECLAMATGIKSEEPVDTLPETKTILKQLRNYIDALKVAERNQRWQDVNKICFQITQLETKFNFQISRTWLVQRFIELKGDDDLDLAWQKIEKQGDRLIECGLDGLAWCFYSDIKRSLTKRTQSWHGLLLTKLTQVSQLLLLPHPKREQMLLQISRKADCLKDRDQIQEQRLRLKNSISEGRFLEQQRAFTEFMRNLMGRWCQEAEVPFSGIGQDLCIAFVGSLSRLRMSPYSDNEFLALTTPVGMGARLEGDEIPSGNAQTDQLEAFFRLLAFKSACEPDGFRWDSEGNPTVERRLFGTPDEIIRLNRPPFNVAPDDNLTFSILHPSYIYGNVTLFRDFQQKLTASLKLPISDKVAIKWEDDLRKNYLNLHIKQMDAMEMPILTGSQNQTRVIDIKKTYVGPLFFAGADTCLYHQIPFTNFDVSVSALVSHQKIHNVWGKAYLQAVALADEIRACVQFQCGWQCDEAILYGDLQSNANRYFLTPEQICQLDLIEIAILRPIKAAFIAIRDYNDDSHLYFPGMVELDQAIKQLSKSPTDSSILCPSITSMEGVIATYILAKCDINAYRSVYLKLPKEWREKFVQATRKFRNTGYLNPSFWNDLDLAFQDCPTPIGERVSEQLREKAWLTQLNSIIVPSQESGIKKDKLATKQLKISWMVSDGALGISKVSGDLHPSITQSFINQGLADKNGKLDLSPEKATLPGRHLVVPITITSPISVKMHWKFYPENPGVHLIAGLFARMLVGWGIPYAKLVRVSYGDHVYPVLVSQTCEGIILHDQMTSEVARVINNLSKKGYSQRFLTSFFLNNEDGKFSNSIAKESLNEKGKFDTHCVDPERAFHRSVLEEEGEIRPIVKEFIYLLDEIREEIDPTVVEDFLTYDPYLFLKHFISRSKDIIEEIVQLFSVDEIKSLFPKAPSLGFLSPLSGKQLVKDSILITQLPEHVIPDLHMKFTRSQSFLVKYPEKRTHFDLLCHSMPYIAKYSAGLLKSYPDTATRFEKGFPKLYRKKDNVSCELETLKNSLATLQTLHGKPIDIKTLLIQARSGETLRDAMEQLENLNQLQTQWESIRDDLQNNLSKGLTALSKVSDDRLREKIVNQLDFRRMTEVFQEVFFQTLIMAKVSFFKLELNSAAISDAHIKQILQNSTELKILVLINCKNITNNILPIIAECCPIIEKLVLRQLKIQIINNANSRLRKLFMPLGSPPPAVLGELEYLDLSCNDELQELNIQAPNVVHFRVNHCRQLKNAVLHSVRLKTLEIEGCVSLTARALSKMVTNPLQLTVLNTKECEQLLHKEFYASFPYLLSVDVSLFSTQKLSQLRLALAPCLESKLLPKQIEEIVESVAVHVKLVEKLKNSLLAALKDNSTIIQQTAALSFMKAGVYEPQLILGLQGLRDSSDKKVKQAAAISLIALGESDPNCYDLVNQSVESDKLDLFSRATSLLTSLGKITPAHTTRLLNDLTNQDPKKREAILLLLAKMGYSAQVVHVAKSLLTTDPNDLVKFACIYLLGYFGLIHPSVMTELTSIITTQFLASRIFMTHCINYVRDKDLAVATQLVTNLRPNVNTQQQVVSDVVAQKMKSPEWRTRVTAIREDLSSIDSHDKSIILLLLQGTRDAHPDVREAALEDLSRRGYVDATVINAVMSLLNSTELKVKKAALNAVNQLCRYNSVIVTSVCKLTKDNDIGVRQAVFHILAKAGMLNEEVIEALSIGLSDSFVTVKQAAIEAIAALITIDNLEQNIKEILANVSSKQNNIKVAQTDSFQGLWQITTKIVQRTDSIQGRDTVATTPMWSRSRPGTPTIGRKMTPSHDRDSLPVVKI